MLTFDAAGGEFGEGVETNRFLYADEEFGELPEATRTGYTFAGWLDENDYEVAATNTMGEADATIYAKWSINQYTVTFVAEDETYAEVTGDYGSEVTAPADPDRGSAYEFLGWDKDVPATIPAEDVTLTALWKLNQIDIPVDVSGDSTNETISVTVGEIYTDEVIEQITAEAQSTATRHGQVVTGWTNYDGSKVTGQTVVSTNDVLTAVWDTENPLVPETDGEGAVDTSKTQKYEAYVLDAETGAMRGTVVVAVGRSNQRTGLSSVKANVQFVGDSKSYMFKATEAKGGKATLSDAESTKGVELYNKKLGTMLLDIGTEGVSGTMGDEYEINGSRNTYKTDKAGYAAWEGTWAAAVPNAATGAYSTFTMKIAKNGSVRIKANLVGGKKLSLSTRLMITDDGSEACVAVKGTKKTPVGFTVWFGMDEEGNVFFENAESESSGAIDVASVVASDVFVGDAGERTLTVAGEEIASLDWNGKKFTGGKSVSARVRYTKSTGAFSGSYRRTTTDAKGRTRKTTVRFSGVFVDGVGYGVTTKGVVGLPVILSPATAK